MEKINLRYKTSPRSSREAMSKKTEAFKLDWVKFSSGSCCGLPALYRKKLTTIPIASEDHIYQTSQGAKI
jgi:hypothetical protein